MKDKKIIIGLIIANIMIIIILISNSPKKDNNNIQTNINTEIKYNSQTEKYEIIDENGKVLHSSDKEDDLDIYKIDPNYDAKNPSNDLENID